MEKQHFIMCSSGVFETNNLLVKERVLKIIKRRCVETYMYGSKKFMSKFYSN